MTGGDSSLSATPKATEFEINDRVAKAAKKLEELEIEVCESYLCDPARKQFAAYRKHHPDVTIDSAYTLASRLFGKVEILEYLDARRAQIALYLDVTPERVLGELAKIGFANPKDYFDWGPEGVIVKPSAELVAEAAAAVSEASQTITKDGGTIRVKLHDKTRALELLGKSLKLFREQQDVNLKPEGVWADILAEIHGRNDERRA